MEHKKLERGSDGIGQPLRKNKEMRKIKAKGRLEKGRKKETEPASACVCIR